VNPSFRTLMLPLLSLLALTAAVSPAFSQEHYGEEEEHYFMNAKIVLGLVGDDSLTVQFCAPAEDMVNTVGIFPYDNSDKEIFRQYEKRMEAYLQDRLPVSVNRKRLFLKVVQWKPGGRGRADGFDSASIYSDQKITLAAKLPPQRDFIDVTANVWNERSDAGRTLVEVHLLQDGVLLKRIFTGREKKIRIPITADSLAVMRKNPPPPLREIQIEE
jgi:hypothetical protein